jgi:hypothetical protein
VDAGAGRDQASMSRLRLIQVRPGHAPCGPQRERLACASDKRRGRASVTSSSNAVRCEAPLRDPLLEHLGSPCPDAAASLREPGSARE